MRIRARNRIYISPRDPMTAHVTPPDLVFNADLFRNEEVSEAINDPVSYTHLRAHETEADL
eukprot:3345462-Amphidinium_carterae.2